MTDAQPDVAGLMARLQRTRISAPGINGERRYIPFNPDGPEAAAALAHLQGENERLVANIRRLSNHDADWRYWENRWRDDVARAEAAEAEVARWKRARDGCEEQYQEAVAREAVELDLRMRAEAEVASYRRINAELMDKKAIVEARVAVLEEALRGIRDGSDDGQGNDTWEADRARAALDQTEVTRRGERGDEP